MRDNKITSRQRLEHILESVSTIQSFIKNSSKETFLENEVLLNAVLFQFAIIGEAINYIDNEILEKYRYPWYKVRSFRNFIIHEYHAIENRIIWEAVENDLPDLKKMVQLILDTEF